MAKLIQIIESQTFRGKGTEEDPGRIVVQYFFTDGKFLCEFDPYKEAK